jgi:enterochelin esterase-like enzyme
MPLDSLQQLKTTMRNLMTTLALFSVLSWGQGQTPKGQIIVEKLTSELLKNTGGENPTRRVTIYLPPGYDLTTNRYPVIYYLHGFTWNDSLNLAWGHLDEHLDKAIATKKIQPVIVVMPNQYTLYRGSMYTNSPLTGNWADFTARDLVRFIDSKYRTIPNSNGRGIAGHSMGGCGAIKLGMLFPKIFSSVYALSPGLLALVKELGPESLVYKRAQQIKTREELVNGWTEGLPNGVVAMGRAYSPNPSNPPFYADLPFKYKGDSLVIDRKVLDLWNKNTPINMVDNYVDNLLSLKALKLDWGRNDEFDLVSVGCRLFSQKLESLGINHYAEEYIGDHSNKVWSSDGRVLNDMLPFFNTYLSFEEIKTRAAETKKKK